MESKLPDAFDVPAVARQQDQRTLQRSGRNEEIGIRNDIPLLPKHSTHSRKVLRGLISRVSHRFSENCSNG